MKKFWLIVLLAAVLAGVGWLIYRFTQNSGNNSLPAPPLPFFPARLRRRAREPRLPPVRTAPP